VTLEPCLNCLKLIISAGIEEVFYETPASKKGNAVVRDIFLAEQLVKLTRIQLSPQTIALAIDSLQNQTSGVTMFNLG
jgi:dCMP deaminase